MTGPRRPLAANPFEPDENAEAVEAAIVAIRDADPAWGARKIACCLNRDGVKPPAVSTVHAVLRRHGRIHPSQGRGAADQRFEKEAANLLWQMDFNGWIRLANGERCHPLIIIDDHSRFAPCLKACANQQGPTVQGHLKTTFERYGLPEETFVDNGSPWGDASGHWTRLRVWLLKLGVPLIYSAPYHPQSRGKNERCHRTLSDEVFALRAFASLEKAQRALDAGARSIISSGRTRPSASPFPPTAIGRARVPSGQAARGRLWRARAPA
jgi:transposase InsO family protein